MSAERQPVADPPDDVDGRPVAALASAVFVLGAAAGICYAIWLGTNQCIRIGGCE